uniref:Reverse transcriptase domain-containing protein n=1 Tax=Oncorhynchus mykiss TaxID=8022 RepID=A0A8C7R9H5_ONCMY
MPSIDTDSHDCLEEEFTLEEIATAVSAMKSGKSPGPDGFPTEFYRTFSGLLCPFLSRLFAECLNTSKLPPSLYQASISLLLKKNKDPLECGSYCPISLLNCDYKILAKLLAIRMEGLLHQVIHSDQTGFVRNRHLFFNIRRLMNILYSPASEDPEVVVSLDAEKAFDRVEWDYLTAALYRFGFGPKFIAWIKILYFSPMASVRTNNLPSDYFPLHRGSRQGCPLSPLLFALAIEPLAIALRSNDAIQGIIRAGWEQKVSLYADDLLLFISNPDTSLPRALSVLKKFGSISGYKLNLGKSELFPVNKAALKCSFTSSQFRIVRDQFTYLGVKVTRKYSNLFQENFVALADRLKQSFTFWNSLPLSLIGRVNVIKMNVLPKFLYLFQCLPIFIPKSFFISLDQTFMHFIWDGKVPRIGRKHLQKPRSLGGLALPNFQTYYWAANFRAVLYWLQTDPTGPRPLWVQMESESCKPAALSSVLCSSLPVSLGKRCANPIVKQSLKIWNQFRLAFSLRGFSLSGPINQNILFPPSLNDGAFGIWHSLGLSSLAQLFFDGTFASFSQLQEKFNLPQSHFFRYLQTRNFVRANTPGFPNRPANTAIESILELNKLPRGAISDVYAIIHDLQNPSLVPLKTRWEKDLGEELGEDAWESVLHRVHSSSFSTRHSLIQFKVVHRIHWSGAKLGRIFSDFDPTCVRCKVEPATLLHMFWGCHKLSGFWELIFKCFSDIYMTLL